MKSIFHFAMLMGSLFSCIPVFGQNTQIRGFVDALSNYRNGRVSFGLGEQDLFITSDLHDRVSFLGESVFKFDPLSSTEFSVSIERIVVKYNFYGNHNILIGKHHTPLSYWNDTYHHGRVFFPTIDRPILFAAGIIPLHTTGISFQGHNLGSLKFGYDAMIGNGEGASEISDNDKNKSIALAAHIKPTERLRFGASYYHDVISAGVHNHITGTPLNWKVKQNLFTGSVSYFGKKFELLAESTLGYNDTDTTGSKRTIASYIYTGYKIGEKLVPYIRLDNLHYQDGEVFFRKDNTTAFAGGLRYHINYLAVIKAEFQHQNTDLPETGGNRVVAQFAIGF